MKTIKLVLATVLCVGMTATYAQKNVIRTKPLRMISGAALGVSPIPLNLSYERAFGPKFSAGLTVQLGLNRELNTINKLVIDPLNEGMDAMATEMGVPNLAVSIGDLSAKSFAISPEIRLYPGSSKEAPRGFYLMAEFFYAKTTYSTLLEARYEFEYDAAIPTVGTVPFTIPVDVSTDLEAAVSSIGGGLGIGTQWLISDRVSIDVLWIGLGAGAVKTHVSAPMEIPGASHFNEIFHEQMEDYLDNTYGSGTYNTLKPSLPMLSSSDIPTLEEVIEMQPDGANNTSGEFELGGSFSPEYSVKGNTLEATMSSLAPRLRLLNFSIGIAF